MFEKLPSQMNNKYLNTRMKNSLFYSNVSASAQPPQTSGPGVQENENLEIWSKNPLADLSQLLLLLLINHSSSSALIAEAPAVPEDHCYRLALYHCYSHKGKYFFISGNDLLCLYFCKISCQILQCTAVL